MRPCRWRRPTISRATARRPPRAASAASSRPRDLSMSALGQHVGHRRHLRALARSGPVRVQHLLQIVGALPRERRHARVGAVAVRAVAAIAALRPLRRGERLADLGRLRLLRRVPGRHVLDRSIVDWGDESFHGLVVARTVLVVLHRDDEIFRVLPGEARNGRVLAHSQLAVTAGAGAGGGLACGLLARRGILGAHRLLQGVIQRDVVDVRRRSRVRAPPPSRRSCAGRSCRPSSRRRGTSDRARPGSACPESCRRRPRHGTRRRSRRPPCPPARDRACMAPFAASPRRVAPDRGSRSTRRP